MNKSNSVKRGIIGIFLMASSAFASHPDDCVLHLRANDIVGKNDYFLPIKGKNSKNGEKEVELADPRKGIYLLGFDPVAAASGELKEIRVSYGKALSNAKKVQLENFRRVPGGVKTAKFYLNQDEYRITWRVKNEGNGSAGENLLNLLRVERVSGNKGTFSLPTEDDLMFMRAATVMKDFESAGVAKYQKNGRTYETYLVDGDSFSLPVANGLPGKEEYESDDLIRFISISDLNINKAKRGERFYWNFDGDPASSMKMKVTEVEWVGDRFKIVGLGRGRKGLLLRLEVTGVRYKDGYGEMEVFRNVHKHLGVTYRMPTRAEVKKTLRDMEKTWNKTLTAP